MFKVAVLGSKGVGKSSFISRVDPFTKISLVEIAEGSDVWMSDYNGFIVMFDLSREYTYKSAERTLNILKKNTFNSPVILVGMKTGLFTAPPFHISHSPYIEMDLSISVHFPWDLFNIEVNSQRMILTPLKDMRDFHKAEYLRKTEEALNHKRAMERYETQLFRAGGELV